MSTGTKVFLMVVLFFVFAVIGLFITQFIWKWVINDVFIGAVQQGLLPTTITLWQAFKLDILFWVLIGSNRANSNK